MNFTSDMNTILMIDTIIILIILFIILRLFRGIKLLNNRLNIISITVRNTKKNLKQLEDKKEMDDYDADEKLRKIIERDFSK